ncbi:hypothetical protein B0H13DRAFT_1917669 [Mycena leptocephala]|nr:hypothetical protein B0H13DRAFT_1917669 [Mycena leptocephala]
MFGTQDDNTRFHPIGLIMVTAEENDLSALSVMVQSKGYVRNAKIDNTHLRFLAQRHPSPGARPRVDEWEWYCAEHSRAHEEATLAMGNSHAAGEPMEAACTMGNGRGALRDTEGGMDEDYGGVAIGNGGIQQNLAMR